MAQRQLYSGLDLYDWRGTGPNGRTKAVDVDKWQQNQEDIRHLPGAFPVQSVVITDGQITPTAAALSVDTEGGAPADDLTAIAPGDLHAGMLLALCSVDTGRKVTIKNSAGASGIQTLDGKDVVLDTQYAVMLRLVSTESLTLWREEPGPLRLQLTVSTPDKLGGVKVQTGDDDGLEMTGDKLRVRQANGTQRGSVLASETAQAGAVPFAGSNGKLDDSWLPRIFDDLRKSWIGVPRYWRSTELPANHCWANGDFVAFADWPELKQVYDAGGFEGMLLPWDADSGTKEANLGKWRPDAANPTGLYTPNLGGQFLRNWIQGEQEAAGQWHRDEIRNITGDFKAYNFMTGYPERIQASGAFGAGDGWGSQSGETGGGSLGLLFDASKVVPTSTEVVPKHIWQPLIIYLGKPA